MKLDVGSGRATFGDYETLDKDPSVKARWQWDLETAWENEACKDMLWKYDEIRAHHILEHIRPENKVKVMATLHRWLKPGGVLDIEVPIAGSEEFWQDPTHLSGWTERSFWYFTKGNKFGEAFAKRYSEYPVPLFEKVSDETNDWKYNIILKKV